MREVFNKRREHLLISMADRLTQLQDAVNAVIKNIPFSCLNHYFFYFSKQTIFATVLESFSRPHNLLHYQVEEDDLVFMCDINLILRW